MHLEVGYNKITRLLGPVWDGDCVAFPWKSQIKPAKRFVSDARSLPARHGGSRKLNCAKNNCRSDYEPRCAFLTRDSVSRHPKQGLGISNGIAFRRSPFVTHRNTWILRSKKSQCKRHVSGKVKTTSIMKRIKYVFRCIQSW
jgi:hypothetical protein